jgi:hypothetical protein
MVEYSEEIDGETRPVTSEYIFSVRWLVERPKEALHLRLFNGRRPSRQTATGLVVGSLVM